MNKDPEELRNKHTETNNTIIQRYNTILMSKLVLEKAEEPEVKLPTSTGSWKKQESSRKTSISALLTMPKPLTVWITINWKILREMGIPDHMTYLLRNLYTGQEVRVRTGHVPGSSSGGSREFKGWMKSARK